MTKYRQQPMTKRKDRCRFRFSRTLSRFAAASVIALSMLLPAEAAEAPDAPALELTAASWQGVRWQDGAWTLVKPIQPDATGRLWMNTAEADECETMPRERSWLAPVEDAVGGKALRQGTWNRNLVGFDVQIG